MAESSYRDSISLVDKAGNRNWVYPKKPKGSLYQGRTWFSIGLMLLLFGGPFIEFNGHPLLLLNVLDRKFIIFGIPFWPQDLPLFALLMMTFVMFVIVFTVVFGRVFCGWACPQTVFMEMLFRKIEYWIEGDYKAQQKLDKQEWDMEKALKKGSKHVLFFALALLIANTFLSYLIGFDEVKKLIIDGPMQHLGKFIALVIFSTVFYLVFAKMRELVCIVVCPYGRLQGLMLDKNSIVVAYDYIRGEPRGFRKKGVEQNLGDCVDCKRCVQVCPTGIDIRNGTQLECINCTACIDECNDVMVKIGEPKGLIRYASQQEIATGKVKRISTRSIAYIIILTVLVSTLTFLLVTRKDVESAVLRTPGLMHQEQGNGLVSNMYNFEVVNKTFHEQQVELVILRPTGATLKMVDRESAMLTLHEDDLLKGSFFIMMPQQQIKANNTEAEVAVFSNGKLMKRIVTNFVAPVKQ
ncbi:MAG: cytochrome c oxidase accessory protein CcoG [Bacteroidetes bacterium]|nr:MAG: cytochrome c oxidase accessory protein CcoG [Bacteroidota bacterium]